MENNKIQEGREENQESQKYVPVELSDLVRGSTNMEGRLVQVHGCKFMNYYIGRKDT
jgi:hypothetical protein